MSLRDEYWHCWPVFRHHCRRSSAVIPQQLAAPQPGAHQDPYLGFAVCPRLHSRLGLDVYCEGQVSGRVSNVVSGLIGVGCKGS